MTTTTYQITGMTCGHCEMSVREEIGEINGVTSVAASHEHGTAIVESATSLDVSAVRAAVEEAGYELAHEE
ncbi:MAG: heavy-metal-associated domain-containing protein [Gulosibacter sp.]|uniref:heavy-metal-associated domain-containing protein n=1 Tax=Gulosibacter sp. TaxID=2817531 RepID=UPI003F907914